MNYILDKTMINVPGKLFEHDPSLPLVLLQRYYPPLKRKKGKYFETRSLKESIQ